MPPKSVSAAHLRRVLKEAVDILKCEFRKRGTYLKKDLPPVVPFLGVKGRAGEEVLMGGPRYWDDEEAYDPQHAHWGWRILHALHERVNSVRKEEGMAEVGLQWIYKNVLQRLGDFARPEDPDAFARLDLDVAAGIMAGPPPRAPMAECENVDVQRGGASASGSRASGGASSSGLAARSAPPATPSASATSMPPDTVATRTAAAAAAAAARRAKLEHACATMASAEVDEADVDDMGGILGEQLSARKAAALVGGMARAVGLEGLGSHKKETIVSKVGSLSQLHLELKGN